MQDAREDKASWTEIGDALGISRQGAYDFYRRAVEDQETLTPPQQWGMSVPPATVYVELVEPGGESCVVWVRSHWRNGHYVRGYSRAGRGAAGGTAAIVVAIAALGVFNPLGVADVVIDQALQAGSPTAVAALTKLPVKASASRAGYDRTRQFGEAWTDAARGVRWADNGCDTRDDILHRDLDNPRVAADDCKITSGTLHDPYTGHVIHFHLGEKTSAAVQIDHVVALGNAWTTGARQLPQDRRIQLANDPLNLIAVDGQVNEAKSDQDAAHWLPPRHSERCAYVARQIAVKHK